MLEDNPGKEDLPIDKGSPGKYALRSFAINILAALVIFLPLLFLRDDAQIQYLFVPLIVGPLSLFVQLIVGIVYMSSQKEKNRNIGKGMVLIVGIFLLIGLSVCGSVRFWV